MKNRASFILIIKSYLISRSLSEMILEEFASVKVLDSIKSIDVLLSIIEKEQAVCILADLDVIELCNRNINSIPDNTNIIPVIDNDAFAEQCNEYQFCINISDNKQRIINTIQKASETVVSNNKQSVKSGNLTSREKVILQLVAKGMTTKLIADKLNISVQTVSSHRKNICSKLEIKSVSGLTAYAIINGLIELNDTNLL